MKEKRQGNYRSQERKPPRDGRPAKGRDWRRGDQLDQEKPNRPEGGRSSKKFGSRPGSRPGSKPDPGSHPESEARQRPDSGEREDSDLTVYGRNPVLAYLEKMIDETGAGGENVPEVTKIFMASGEQSDPRLDKINRLATRMKIPVVQAPRTKLDFLAGRDARHQGVVAQLSPVKLLEMADLIRLIASEKKRRADAGKTMDGYTLVALDGIEDPRNVGAIVRAAEAIGAGAVLVPERRAAGITATVAKTSAGALAHLPCVRVGNLVRALEELKEEGFWIAGLAPEAPGDIYHADLIRPLVLVVGNEGKGLGRLVGEHCDMLLRIPLAGRTESLNASVAAGIGLYEIYRQNHAGTVKREPAGPQAT